MEETNKNKVSVWNTILWMIITGLVVFIITSYHYTSQILGIGDVFGNQASINNIGFINGNIAYKRTSGENFPKLEKVFSVVKEQYLYDFDMEKLEEGAINGMLDALDDPYTSYFNLNDTENFLTETEGEYDGIGVYIAYDTSNDTVIVLSPIKNSPADKAGVLPGDYILEIDEKKVVGSTIEEVAKEIKGKRNSEVVIKFRRYTSKTEYEDFEKTIPRESIDLSAFSYKVLDGNIGYISFESFDEKIYDNFSKAYKQLRNKNKVNGLIIDIRNNGGGLFNEAVKIIDDIIPTGTITYTVDKYGNKQTEYSDSEEIDIPLVVLVNENSASASEIMAGAIKDFEKGKIVGKTTYGKGLVQSFKSLLDGTYLKITISEYFSPKGNKINKNGVTPDVEVENDKETEGDEQLDKAIEVLNDLIKNNK